MREKGGGGISPQGSCLSRICPEMIPGSHNCRVTTETQYKAAPTELPLRHPDRDGYAGSTAKSVNIAHVHGNYIRDKIRSQDDPKHVSLIGFKLPKLVASYIEEIYRVSSKRLD